MTASTKPKTPSMTLAVRADAIDRNAQAFCKRATRLTLSEIVENVVVNEQLLASRRRRYTVNIHFYPKDEYREEHDVKPAEILASFAVRFPQMLKKEITQEFKKLDADIKTLNLIGKGQAASQSDDNGGEVDEDVRANGDDESEIGDGDADHEKRARQTQEVTTYDTDEEDEALQGEYDEATLEAEYAEPAADEKESVDGDLPEAPKKPSPELEKQAGDVRTKFYENLKAATSFDFSKKGACFDLEV